MIKICLPIQQLPIEQHKKERQTQINHLFSIKDPQNGYIREMLTIKFALSLH